MSGFARREVRQANGSSNAMTCGTRTCSLFGKHACFVGSDQNFCSEDAAGQLGKSESSPVSDCWLMAATTEPPHGTLMLPRPPRRKEVQSLILSSSVADVDCQGESDSDATTQLGWA